MTFLSLTNETVKICHILIFRHDHQHNMSAGLSADEIAKLPPRRLRHTKTVNISILNYVDKLKHVS